MPKHNPSHIMGALKLRAVKAKKPSFAKEQSYRPSLHLSFKDLPEAKEWEVGKTYKLAMEVKQVSKSIREGEGDASFEIFKIKGA